MKSKLVTLAVVGSLLISVGLMLQRTITSYVNHQIGQALLPVSGDISDLNGALLSFEKDLTELKQTASVVTTAPITAPAADTTITAATIPTDSDRNSINLNTASLSQLMSLPGIGASYAQRIVETRPFNTVDDLDRVKGIGSKTIEKLRPLVTAP